MRLRLANIDDLPAIAALDPISDRSAWLRRRIERGECTVAEVEGSPELAGFLVDDDAFFDRTFIRLVVTAQAHRRRGVADALVADAERRARTETVFSSSNRSNVAMRALLLKRGWVESGVIEGLEEPDPRGAPLPDPETVFRKRVR